MSILTSPTLLLHRFIVSLIRSYKWVELQVFRAIAPALQWIMLKMVDDLGLVAHFTEEGDIYSADKWTPEQEAAWLRKCAPKYNSLIHLQINDKKEFFARTANTLNLGLGETFMEEIWSCPQGEAYVAQFVARFMESGLLAYVFHPWNRFLNYMEISCFNLLQCKAHSLEVCDLHFNLGNDLYQTMLDPWMQYTCAYWAKATNLNDAQQDKLDLLARKLDLKPGIRVLEIGCGFGMLCKYLAERHGVQCVGINISEEQITHAREKCKGLPVEIRYQDYRELNEKEKFDRVVVVGMIEHVGFRNYEEFFQVVRRNLKDDGIFVLHTIGLENKDDPRSEGFFHKYIFPNGNVPFPSDITQVTFGKFIIEDWHNFGLDYAKTLAAWRENFCANWPTIRNKYGDKFYRMWIYYLTLSEGMFLARHTRLWHIVLSPQGLKREYRAPR